MVNELTPRAQEADVRLAALRAQIVAEQITLDGLSSQVTTLRSTEAVVKAANAELEERKKFLDAAITTAQTQLSAAQSGLASSEKAAAEIEARLVTLGANFTKAASALSSTEQERAAMGAEIFAAQNTLAGLNAEIAARGIVRSALAEAEQRFADMEKSLSAKSVESAALAESVAQGRADLTLATRDNQLASEELLSARAELTLAQNRLAELNAEIASRSIVRSALEDVEQRLVNIEASVAAKSKESTALTETLAGYRVQVATAIADLEASQSQMADVSAQRTNAEIRRDEAIRTAQATEQRALEMNQSIQARTQEFDRLQVDIRKAQIDLERETEALESARAAMRRLAIAPVADPTQVDNPETVEGEIPVQRFQTDLKPIDPASERALKPNQSVPANGDDLQEKPPVAVQGERN
jgi:chromosome segregation ATPase